MENKKQNATKRSMKGAGKVVSKDLRKLEASHAAHARRPSAARRKPANQAH